MHPSRSRPPLVFRVRSLPLVNRPFLPLPHLHRPLPGRSPLSLQLPPLLRPLRPQPASLLLSLRPLLPGLLLPPFLRSRRRLMGHRCSAYPSLLPCSKRSSVSRPPTSPQLLLKDLRLRFRDPQLGLHKELSSPAHLPRSSAPLRRVFRSGQPTASARPMARHALSCLRA